MIFFNTRKLIKFYFQIFNDFNFDFANCFIETMRIQIIPREKENDEVVRNLRSEINGKSRYVTAINTQVCCLIPVPRSRLLGK